MARRGVEFAQCAPRLRRLDLPEGAAASTLCERSTARVVLRVLPRHGFPPHPGRRCGFLPSARDCSNKEGIYLGVTFGAIPFAFSALNRGLLTGQSLGYETVVLFGALLYVEAWFETAGHWITGRWRRSVGWRSSGCARAARRQHGDCLVAPDCRRSSAARGSARRHRRANVGDHGILHRCSPAPPQRPSNTRTDA
jgi:hypothetical protein